MAQPKSYPEATDSKKRLEQDTETVGVLKCLKEVSCCGTVRSGIEAGGNSTHDSYRRSINVNFNLAWLKQRENQFVGVPPEVVVAMSEPLQALIGYKLTNFGLGSVDYQNPIETVKKRMGERSRQSELA